MNIFIYNVGQDKEVSKIMSRLKKQGFNVILGPTHEDQKYLMENSSYYKRSFDEGVFSFASDIGRMYKMANSVGAYIDTSVRVGPHVRELFDKLSKSNFALAKTGDMRIASSVIYSNKSKHASKIFELIKNLELPENVKDVKFVLPDILAMYFYDLGILKKGDGSTYESEEISLFDLMLIRDKKSIFKEGAGTGFDGSKIYAGWMKKRDAHKGGKNIQKRWQSKSDKDFNMQTFLKNKKQVFD